MPFPRRTGRILPCALYHFVPVCFFSDIVMHFVYGLFCDRRLDFREVRECSFTIIIVSSSTNQPTNHITPHLTSPHPTSPGTEWFRPPSRPCGGGGWSSTRLTWLRAPPRRRRRWRSRYPRSTGDARLTPCHFGAENVMTTDWSSCLCLEPSSFRPPCRRSSSAEEELTTRGRLTARTSIARRVAELI